MEIDLHEILKDMSADNDKKEVVEPWSLALTPEYKKKFHELQEMTNKSFGKKLREIVSTAIDYAYKKDVA